MAGMIGKGLERLEEVTGWSLERKDRLDFLEESLQDARLLDRELRDLAYTALDYVGGKPQDLKAEERRKLAQKARVVWMKDPQAGASVDLMNDFTFGRGVPLPKAKDKAVQEVLEEAWNDPVNQRILTSHEAQLALGTDLSLQSNLFLLMFDDGDDGRVRLSLLNHDAVENVVEHPEDRFCVLWFVARVIERRWDFEHDEPESMKTKGAQERLATDSRGKPKILYYRHWRNVDQAEEDETLPAGYAPPKAKVGDGKVFHVAENRGSEMHFGHPRMDRTLRWFSAYNRFMEARVDMMAAAAAFVMKRKVKGTPQQLSKQAARALTRRSDLGISDTDDLPVGGPRSASVLNENEQVTHEDFKLTTNSGDAAQDARMLGAQISAATRWPRTYYGDAEGGVPLATATSLELPILKGVETRQEFCESIFRWFCDRVIERAVETGRLNKSLKPDEVQEAINQRVLTGVLEAGGGRPRRGESPLEYVSRVLALVESHEDKAKDEVATDRDLTYDFRMPNPLRRAIADMVTAIQSIAQTFDPNNTNTELSRILLLVALEEVLELPEAAEVVEKIFPPGYVDPSVAAAQNAGEDFGPFGPQQGDVPGVAPPQQPGANGNGGPPPAPPGGAVGADGQRHQAGNPYGAPMRAQTPEQAMGRLQGGAVPSWWPRDRFGEPLDEALFRDQPPEHQQEVARRVEAFDEQAARELGPIVEDVLAGLGAKPSNGNGRH